MLKFLSLLGSVTHALGHALEQNNSDRNTEAALAALAHWPLK